MPNKFISKNTPFFLRLNIRLNLQKNYSGNGLPLLLPSLKGHNEQSVTVQSFTSFDEPTQQSMQFERIAFSNLFLTMMS